MHWRTDVNPVEGIIVCLFSRFIGPKVLATNQSARYTFAETWGIGRISAGP
jgi:hypothetical protein